LSKLGELLPRKIREKLYVLSTPIRYYIAKKKYLRDKSEFSEINFIDDFETIDLIMNEKLSLCRFGDGELKWILKIKQKSFQKSSDELSVRLREIISKNEDENILIGIPNVFGSLFEFRYKSKVFWREHTNNYRNEWMSLINLNSRYSNSLITRYYTNYKNEKQQDLIFSEFSRIWNDRDVVIVEGSKSRLGIGNDLFSNMKSIKRILAPAQNAFSKYNQILQKTIEIAKKQDIILIALGPTATVLAYDLAKLGYQALDIGHLDVEYDWKRMNVNKKIPISGKFVNEASSIDDLSENEIYDKYYYESIIINLDV
jgi:glycosyltransferase family protein